MHDNKKEAGMKYNSEVISNIAAKLIKKEETIAVAESVTSGHLQAALAMGIDASKYFQGGMTAYNIGQKVRHLNIEPTHAQQVNCVSKNVAAEMATEVSEKFISNYGVGITGYATIVPQCEADGLHAFFAIAYNGKIIKEGKLTSTLKDPTKVQVAYTNDVLAFLEKLINKKVTSKKEAAQ